jgi:hypothetical protein
MIIFKTEYACKTISGVRNLIFFYNFNFEKTSKNHAGIINNFINQ